jgi:uncharacterized protein YlzI (FlbEa/FlbD family)
MKKKYPNLFNMKKGSYFFINKDITIVEKDIDEINKKIFDYLKQKLTIEKTYLCNC